MRLLHLGPDLLGGRDVGRGQGWISEPRQRRRRFVYHRADRRGDSGTDERQHLSLWRLPEHRRRHPASRERRSPMRPFTYERATTTDAALAAVAASGAKFISG